MVNRLVILIMVFLSGSAAFAQTIVQQNHTLMVQAIRNKDLDEIRKLAATPYVMMNELDMKPFYIETAVGTGDISTIKLVFDVGARILQSGQWAAGKETYNCFLLATRAARRDILQLLIDEFKREKKAPKTTDKPYTLPEMFAAQFNGQDCLMIAYFNSNADLGLLLLENGADPNTKGFYGVTAMWFAVRTTPICEKCLTKAGFPEVLPIFVTLASQIPSGRVLPDWYGDSAMVWHINSQLFSHAQKLRHERVSAISAGFATYGIFHRKAGGPARIRT